MKSLIATVAAATVLAVPAVSFAQQSNGPLTRAQVKSELIQLENAGYSPNANTVNYPNDIQAAEARVHPQQDGAVADTSGYGAQPAAGAESGTPSKVRRIADGAPVYKGR
ncbi:hypothetical protein B7760_04368 [Burkholderia glumae]|uniref:DUF4148 domain-containing protein n=1 Tax=Burkholderia glumae TaxID=337 RepID=UPI0013740078|nr:DUF4148 domain-containing protein [Burkholderia glumae]MCR1768170.1 DUF4148 domain-containing protein [Burkholderia glumae]QHP92770.1 DUF4148 domain-containing protein [Burkholderia glumae]QKM50306.1 hypothetical protein B7760_04368 [Burkholderia glumae]